MADTITGEFETTLVLPLPFINLDPGNLTTIYSALLFAQKMARQHGQSMCAVTFDQPLYIKAAEMVASADINSPLKQIWVRLGGFHLLMSFLGSIGYIMSDSGLEDMWTTIYAKNSTTAMMTGHSYARSVRAHFLSHLALMLNLLKFECFDHIDKEIVQADYLTFERQQNSNLEQIHKMLIDKMQEEECSSRTGKFWCQYIKLIDLVKMFIYAERSGDFELHLRNAPFFSFSWPSSIC